MNLPGFTAEAALGRASNYYGSASNSAGGGSVTAQLRPIRNPFKPNCIPGCICVSPINCPCCTDFPLPLDTFGGGINERALNF